MCAGEEHKDKNDAITRTWRHRKVCIQNYVRPHNPAARPGAEQLAALAGDVPSGREGEAVHVVDLVLEPQVRNAGTVALH